MELEIKRLIINHQKKLILAVLQAEHSDKPFREVYKVVIIGKKPKNKRPRNPNPEPKPVKTPKSDLDCIARTSKLSQCQNKAELNCDFCLKHTENHKYGTIYEQYVKPAGVKKLRVIDENSCIARTSKGEQCVYSHIANSQFCKKHTDKLEYGTIHEPPMPKKPRKTKTSEIVSEIQHAHLHQEHEHEPENEDIEEEVEEEEHEDQEEEDEAEVEEFTHNGVTYWKDSDNTIYGDDDEPIGTYDPSTDTINFH